MVFYILSFLVSIFLLAWLGSHLVKTLVDLAKYLGWREFVVAFFVMAIAGSLPNLFVDISAAIRGFPELAFGDILGGNLVDLTFVMALAVFMGRKKTVPAKSNMIQFTAIFTAIIAILPLFLILDGSLDRIDGVVLIGAFLIYAVWLFSKEDRFKKVYNHRKKQPVKDFKGFVKNIFKIIIFLVVLLIASQVIINSAQYFSVSLGMPISLVGLIIVGLGNCFPETYFSLVSARRGEGWMILGDLMGSVISCASLVLGIVAIISPFQIHDFSPFLIARIFLVAAIILFLVIIRSDKRITKKEALILLLMYVLFLLVEIFKPYLF